MSPERYYRSVGPTPLDDMDVNDQRAFTVAMQHAVWARLIEELGGSVVVSGLGEPAAVMRLLYEYEIGLKGLGDGRIQIRLVRKDEAPNLDSSPADSSPEDQPHAS